MTPQQPLSSCPSVLTAGQHCPSFSWSRQHFQLWLSLLILKSVEVVTEVTDTGLKLLWGAATHTKRGAGGLMRI